MRLIDSPPKGWHAVTGANMNSIVPNARLIHLHNQDIVIRDTQGVGPIALLIHGWCADGLLNWAPDYLALHQAGWRVIGIDLPGHGGTPLVGKFSLTACADLLAKLLKKMHIKSVTTVGYSMGGPVSQLLAQRHPDLVDGMVFAATAARVIHTSVPRSSMRLLPALFHASSTAQALTRAITRNPPPAPDDSSLVSHAARIATAMDHHALLDAARELADFDSRMWVGTLNKPAVSIITTHDHAVPEAAQHDLATRLNAKELVIDLGHIACTRAEFPTVLVNALALLPYSPTPPPPPALPSTDRSSITTTP